MNLIELRLAETLMNCSEFLYCYRGAWKGFAITGSPAEIIITNCTFKRYAINADMMMQQPRTVAKFT